MPCNPLLSYPNYHLLFPYHFLRSKNSMRAAAAEACQLFSADVRAAVACNNQYTPALASQAAAAADMSANFSWYGTWARATALYPYPFPTNPSSPKNFLEFSLKKIYIFLNCDIEWCTNYIYIVLYLLHICFIFSWGKKYSEIFLNFNIDAIALSLLRYARQWDRWTT